MGIAERWRGYPPLPADIAQRLERLPALFATRPVSLAYVFGSLDRGAPADDVDLALLMLSGSAVDLWEEIVATLGTDRLDLVDLAAASPVLRFEIVREGRLLYRESEDAENEFELAAIREYRDTAHRRAIQNAYLAEWASRWS